MDLLLSHRAGDKGSILNALDLPLPGAPHFPLKIASDVQAFNSTLDMPSCGRDVLYPVPSMKWALAATTGAHHAWHIDCNGFGTVIDVQAGYKWWVVAEEKTVGDFASISLFLDNFSVDKVNEHKWLIEAILLAPGSRL